MAATTSTSTITTMKASEPQPASKPSLRLSAVWKESMMTIAFKSCPRCTGDLRANSDHYGSFVACLTCGYVKDDVPVDQLDATDQLPYVGINAKWDNLVVSYTEILKHTLHQPITRVIVCPFNVAKDSRLCNRDMEKTGNTVTRLVRQGGDVESKSKSLNEWACTGGHSIGISRGGYIWWA